ncbi:hypothetical protein LC040_06735 [Bacillus tianshenii]|nr:hypothetical protein LC040_06735 [Bacillus tianshenii]
MKESSYVICSYVHHCSDNSFYFEVFNDEVSEQTDRSPITVITSAEELICFIEEFELVK